MTVTVGVSGFAPTHPYPPFYAEPCLAIPPRPLAVGRVRLLPFPSGGAASMSFLRLAAQGRIPSLPGSAGRKETVMSTVNVSRAFVATNPVFPNEIRVVEEQADGTILVTRARYDGAYASARHNNLRMPPRSEWEAGGWRNHESYVPVTGFNTTESCRQHFDQVCGDLIVDIVL